FHAPDLRAQRDLRHSRLHRGLLPGPDVSAHPDEPRPHSNLRARAVSIRWASRTSICSSYRWRSRWRSASARGACACSAVRAEGGGGDVGGGVGWFARGMGLVVYGNWFVRKMKGTP